MLTTRAAPPADAPAAALWRDRRTLFTGVALFLVVAGAWVGVVRQATSMDAGMGTGMDATAFSLPDAAAFTAGWGVMMAAMMLPSAVPMIALYGTVSRNLARSGNQVVPTSVFTATYLVVWLALGIPVYAVTVALGALVSSAPAVGGWLPYALALVLVGAGAYQFTAIKRVCLRYCQTPLSFLMSRWRSGYAATLRLGIAHATYCVGCCWGLMVVLVAAGAMSLQWVLLIAAIVFVEKLLPRGEWVARGVGAALVVLGVAVAVHPALAVALRGQSMAPGMPGM